MNRNHNHARAHTCTRAKKDGLIELLAASA